MRKLIILLMTGVRKTQNANAIGSGKSAPFFHIENCVWKILRTIKHIDNTNDKAENIVTVKAERGIPRAMPNRVGWDLVSYSYVSLYADKLYEEIV